MKKAVVFSTVAALLPVFHAYAADLPSRAPPPVIVSAPVTWTGFYIGGQLGYLEQTTTPRSVGSNLFDSSGLAAARLYANTVAQATSGPIARPQGITAGGQIGYNYQIGSYVLGVEADLVATAAGSRQFGSSSPIPGFVDVVTTRVSSNSKYEYFGTARGRLGYLASPDLLLYGTGGFAYADHRQTISVNNTINVGFPVTFVVSPFGGTVQSSRIVTGYTVGGGFEYALTGNWSVKTEALYYNLGNSTTAGQFNSLSRFVTPPTVFTTNGVRATNDNSGYTVRVGLNYRFDLL